MWWGRSCARSQSAVAARAQVYEMIGKLSSLLWASATSAPRSGVVLDVLLLARWGALIVRPAKRLCQLSSNAI